MYQIRSENRLDFNCSSFFNCSGFPIWSCGQTNHGSGSLSGGDCDGRRSRQRHCVFFLFLFHVEGSGRRWGCYGGNIQLRWTHFLGRRASPETPSFLIFRSRNRSGGVFRGNGRNRIGDLGMFFMELLAGEEFLEPFSSLTHLDTNSGGLKPGDLCK